MNKFCFLFGHRDAPESILPQIEQAVEEKYLMDGIKEFVVGHRGNFDSLSARAVRSVKAKHPEIRLTRLLAYHPANGRKEDESLGATYYPEGMENVPKRLAIVRANQKAVDAAHSLICYVNRIGNTRELLEYAEKKKGIGCIKNLA